MRLLRERTRKLREERDDIFLDYVEKKTVAEINKCIKGFTSTDKAESYQWENSLAL